MMNRLGKILSVGILCVALANCGSSGPRPILDVSSDSASFVGVQGSVTEPAPSSIMVTNGGRGVLDFTASSDSPWLSVTPTSGSAPGTLQVSATIGSLAPNAYTGHVTVTDAKAKGSPKTITVTFTVGTQTASTTPFWPQWGSNPQHTGMVAVAGQNLNETFADIVYDPFVTQEKAENTILFGEAVLTVHAQAPITDGNDVYMVMKMGTYNSCPAANPSESWINGGQCGPNTWDTMDWCEVRFSWVDGQLVEAWSFDSDWYPEPNAVNFGKGFGGLDGWEPVFHPADTPNFLYVPGAAGEVWKVNKNTGAAVSHINPFSGNGSVNEDNTYVASPLTADLNGNIYYNVIELNMTPNTDGNSYPWNQYDVMNAWLVKIAPDDTTTIATFSSLTPGAPAGTSLTCPGTYYDNASLPAFPWPPSGVSPAPFPGPCGSQRPGLNVAPAVSADGMTVYTASRAHFDQMVSYLLAANTSDLSPKWAASLQDRLTDGCGGVLPIAGPGVTNLAYSCLNGTTVGVDPTTNSNGSGQLIDEASSSPTVLPDGSIVLGTVDNYNFSRGHLMRFDANGNYVGAYGFGWDSTPGVWVQGGTFSVVIKDNHYNSTAYCSGSSPVCASTPEGPYYITQLDSSLTPEWSFQSTTTDADHPNGYEWCINMPAIDMNGNVYVNSEDGNAYELPQGNSGVFTVPTGKIFLNSAIGAAYTPLSLGADGKAYTQNNGQLFVVGN